MNKYLIVVFCVLTGCAVVVPYNECEALNIDTELLAEWYADYGDTMEENYAINYVLRYDTETEAVLISTAGEWDNHLLQNLPSLPQFALDELPEWPPVFPWTTELKYERVVMALNKAIGQDLKIRAPDAC